MSAPQDFSATIARFSGFAELYDAHRPGPPAMLASLLSQFTGIARPAHVVDLGCGTGLSTRYWADKAVWITGIEPVLDMIRQARLATTADNITYREGFSHATGLSPRSARVACCIQSLHWIEPAGTFSEAARFLEKSGVFAACDYDWPPVTSSWEANAAFESSFRTARRFEKELGLTSDLPHWDKAGHLQRMDASGCFRHVKECCLHHVDTGNAARLIGLLLTQGFVQGVLKRGVTETALGIDALRHIALRTLGDTPAPFFWAARVRIGVV